MKIYKPYKTINKYYFKNIIINTGEFYFLPMIRYSFSGFNKYLQFRFIIWGLNIKL